MKNLEKKWFIEKYSHLFPSWEYAYRRHFIEGKSYAYIGKTVGLNWITIRIHAMNYKRNFISQ